MAASSAPHSEIPHPIADQVDGEEALPAPTLADVAHIVFPHLASCTAAGESIECSVAELCILLAKTDVAGCYGPPGVAHDTLLDAIWASVAAAVPAGPSAGPTGDGAALPSLHDALRDAAGYAPFRLLKKYLAAADLPFFGSAPHDVLLAAMPKLAPPRLIALSRRARRSPQWQLSLLTARMQARGLELPRPEHLPEAMGVEELAVGDLTYLTLAQLETFLVECAFLRQHCDLEEILEEAVVDAEADWAGDAFLEEIEDLAEVPFEEIIDVYDVARARALADIIEDQGGIDAVRCLPGLPSTLAADLGEVAWTRRACRQQVGLDDELTLELGAWMEEMVGLLHGDDLPEELVDELIFRMGGLPPPQVRPPQVASDAFRCGHAGCRGATQTHTEQGFVQHWNSEHRAGQTPAAPQRGAYAVRCVHPECGGGAALRTFTFHGLRQHTGAVHGGTGPWELEARPTPVAVLDESVCT